MDNKLPDSAAWETLREPFRDEIAAEERAGEVTVIPEQPRDCGGLKGFVRRLAAPFVRWYAEPIVAEQNRVNRQLRRELDELRARLDAEERR